MNNAFRSVHFKKTNILTLNGKEAPAIMVEGLQAIYQQVTCIVWGLAWTIKCENYVSSIYFFELVQLHLYFHEICIVCEALRNNTVVSHTHLDLWLRHKNQNLDYSTN